MRYVIWMTLNCNLSCSYCYENDKKNKIINMETINDTINFINKTYEFDNELYVQFHGGEPLLEFEKIEYITNKLNYSINKKIKYSMTTNGTLLTDEMAQFFTRNEFDITISIDGNINSHDKNRKYINGDGSFNDVLKNIYILHKYYRNFRLRMTVTRNNIENFYSNVLYLSNLGEVAINYVIDVYDEWKEEELESYYYQLEQLVNKFKGNKKYDYLFINAQEKQKNSICSGGTSTFHISADGSIYPCTYAVENNKYKIGNVVDGINQPHVKYIRSLNDTPNEMCVGCSRHDYCDATRCKIINEIMTGNPHIPSPILCELENISININKYFIYSNNKVVN